MDLPTGFDELRQCVACGRPYHRNHKCAGADIARLDGAHRRALNAEDDPTDYLGHPGHFRTVGDRLEEGFRLLREAGDQDD